MEVTPFPLPASPLFECVCVSLQCWDDGSHMEVMRLPPNKLWVVGQERNPPGPDDTIVPLHQTALHTCRLLLWDDGATSLLQARLSENVWPVTDGM